MMENGEVIRELLILIVEAANAGNISRVEKLTSAAKALAAGNPPDGQVTRGSPSNAQERQKPEDNEVPSFRQHITAQAPGAYPHVPSPRSLGKKQGRTARQTWLAERAHEGTPLVRLRGRLYQNGNGKRIGISFANERPEGGKWWMGLPDEEYDVIVLLCRSSEGEVLDFLFPREFLAPFWRFFSRGGPDQVEFHVEQRGSIYVLGIPGRPPQSVANSLARYEFLR